MKQRVAITIDVEALHHRAEKDHIDRLIWGNYHDGSHFGLDTMMTLADKHDMRLTCFLDYVEREHYGEALLDVGREIVRRGHDLALHQHPDAFSDSFWQKQGLPKVHDLCHTDEAQCRASVNYILESHSQVTSQPPLVYRSGSYRLSWPLLKVLGETSVRLDSSYNPVEDRNPLGKAFHPPFFWSNGLFEVPISALLNFRGNGTSSYNFNSSILMSDSVEQCLKQHQEYLDAFFKRYGDTAIATLVMHSWSFYKADSNGFFSLPQPEYVEIFTALLEMYAKNYEVVALDDVAKNLDEEKQQAKPEQLEIGIPENCCSICRTPITHFKENGKIAKRECPLCHPTEDQNLRCESEKIFDPAINDVNLLFSPEYKKEKSNILPNKKLNNQDIYLSLQIWQLLTFRDLDSLNALIKNAKLPDKEEMPVFLPEYTPQDNPREQTFQFLDRYLFSIGKNSDDKLAIDFCLKAIFTWHNVYNFLEDCKKKSKSTFDLVWNDDDASLRTVAITIILQCCLKNRNILTAEKLELLFRIAIDHFFYLTKDVYYASQYNHGMFQNLALFNFAWQFPEIMYSHTALKIAEQRILKMIQERVSSDGVFKEHSPGYHVVFFTLCYQFCFLYDKIELAPTIKTYLDKMQECVWDFMLPNATLASLGDTKDNTNVPEYLFKVLTNSGYLKKTDRQLTKIKIYKDAGYALIRNRNDSAESYLLLVGAFHSRIHKHCDDLSFIWSEGSRNILVDTALLYKMDKRLPPNDPRQAKGFWYDNQERIYSESPNAHNVVEINGEPYSRTVKPYGALPLETSKISEGIFSLTGTWNRPDGFNQKRTLIFCPNCWLLVLDNFTANSAQTKDATFTQWFQLDPTAKLLPEKTMQDLPNMCFELDGRRFYIHTLVHASNTIHKGETTPRLQGWHASVITHLTPSWSLGFHQKGKEAHFATLFSLDKPCLKAEPIWKDGQLANLSLSFTEGKELKLDLSTLYKALPKSNTTPIVQSNKTTKPKTLADNDMLTQMIKTMNPATDDVNDLLIQQKVLLPNKQVSDQDLYLTLKIWKSLLCNFSLDAVTKKVVLPKQENIPVFLQEYKPEVDPYYPQSFSFLDPYLMYMAQNPEDKVALAFCVKVLFAWHHVYGFFEDCKKNASNVTLWRVWYDAYPGLRLVTITFMLQYCLKNRDAVSPQILEQIFRIAVDHFLFLTKDEFYNSTMNHGMFQNFALFNFAWQFPEVKGATIAQKIAGKRILKMIQEHVSSEGVFNEHSPQYHVDFLSWLYQLCTLYSTSEVTVAIKSYMEKMLQCIKDFMLPDASLAPLGDSRGIFTLPEYLLKIFADLSCKTITQTTETIKIYKNAGYALVRSHIGNAESYLLLVGSFHSQAHKHCDDLSFVWSEGASNILTDTAKIDKMEKHLPQNHPLRSKGYWFSDPERIYSESVNAHNMVEINGESYSRTVKPYGALPLSAGKISKSVFYLTGYWQRPEGYCQKRTLLLCPNRWLLVLDDLVSTMTQHKEENIFTQWFQFDPKTKIVSQKGDTPDSTICFDLENRFLYVQSLISAEVKTHIGEVAPRHQGWHATMSMKLDPAYSLSFHQHGKDVKFATLFSLDKPCLKAEPVWKDGKILSLSLNFEGKEEKLDLTPMNKTLAVENKTEEDRLFFERSYNNLTPKQKEIYAYCVKKLEENKPFMEYVKAYNTNEDDAITNNMYAKVNYKMCLVRHSIQFDLLHLFDRLTHPELPQETILDIGCGLGYFSYFAALFGHKVVSLEHADLKGTHTIFADGQKVLGLNMLYHTIKAFQPLPKKEKYTLAVAFAQHFNNPQTGVDNYWKLEEWRYFLHDLACSMQENGKIYFEMNLVLLQPKYPVFGSPEVESLFRQCGASIIGYKIMFSSIAPILNIINKKISMKNLPFIKKINITYQAPNLLCNVETIDNDEGYEFAFYVYRNDVKIHQVWYQKENKITFDTKNIDGVYTIRPFVKFGDKLESNYSSKMFLTSSNS